MAKVLHIKESLIQVFINQAKGKKIQEQQKGNQVFMIIISFLKR